MSDDEPISGCDDWIRNTVHEPHQHTVAGRRYRCLGWTVDDEALRRSLAAPSDYEPLPIPRGEIKACALAVLSEFPPSSPLYPSALIVHGWLTCTTDDEAYAVPADRVRSDS